MTYHSSACLCCGREKAHSAFAFSRKTGERDDTCRACKDSPTESIRLAQLVLDEFPEATWESQDLQGLNRAERLSFSGLPPHAVYKCLDRKDEFKGLGWTKFDLFGRAEQCWGHHGLAWSLRPHHCLGQIWEWCVEILGRPDGSGERSRTHYWKREPFTSLVVTVGRHVIPREIWREIQ